MACLYANSLLHKILISALLVISQYCSRCHNSAGGATAGCGYNDNDNAGQHSRANIYSMLHVHSLLIFENSKRHVTLYMPRQGTPPLGPLHKAFKKGQVLFTGVSPPPLYYKATLLQW